MKKICLLILASAFVLGTIVAALPLVKAADPQVRFYVEDISDHDNVYAGKAPPPPFPPPAANVKVQVLIESPISWMGTPDGIIGFMVSVRVDPRALTVKSIVAPTVDLQGDTFVDDFLAMYAAYLVYMGYDVTTLAGPAGVDPATGTMYGFSYALTGPGWVPTLGGAGGNVYDVSNIAVLCEIQFVSKSATIPSLIDLMGQGVSTTGQIVKGIEVSCKYTNARGEKIMVEPEDGYYVQVVDTMYFDSTATIPQPPTFSDWHELAPAHSQMWSMEKWTDYDANQVLSASDTIEMATPGTTIGGLIDWVNTVPVANDGLADMIITVIPIVPEFPLGIGVLMAIVPLIPIVYIWRLRKRSR